MSGDQRTTAERLVQLGVPPADIASYSCARTIWQNAILTAAWLEKHHSGAPVVQITDPWQRPRTSRVFTR